MTPPPATASGPRTDLTVLILTRNEEPHIARCLASVADIATRCVVVDSGSTDRTVEIAAAAGAQVLYNAWVNYATQMNWGIDRIGPGAGWIMRLDADEIVSDELRAQIAAGLADLPDRIDGVYVSRYMTFQGRLMRHGGLFPVRVLRLFRQGRGRCEMRWMDEHIVVTGQTADLPGHITDDNRNGLTWWTDKHNGYASREVVDLLNLEYGFMPHETVADLRQGRQAGVKRWVKETLYARFPRGLRALVYFLYRYILRLGFLDGREGTAFHVLQGFWYRFLVDAKLAEVKAHMRAHDVDAVTAIRAVLGIVVAPGDGPAR